MITHAQLTGGIAVDREYTLLDFTLLACSTELPGSSVLNCCPTVPDRTASFSAETHLFG